MKWNRSSKPPIIFLAANTLATENTSSSVCYGDTNFMDLCLPPTSNCFCTNFLSKSPLLIRSVAVFIVLGLVLPMILMTWKWKGLLRGSNMSCGNGWSLQHIILFTSRTELANYSPKPCYIWPFGFFAAAVAPTAYTAWNTMKPTCLNQQHVWKESSSRRFSMWYLSTISQTISSTTQRNIAQQRN